MSEQQSPKRFFIEWDLVRHKPTGVLYHVYSLNDYEDKQDIFWEGQPVELQDMDMRDGYTFPFDELELVESRGVYMGAGITSQTAPTIEELGNVLGDTNRLIGAIARRVGVFDERDICRCKCKITHPPTPKPVKANSVTWLFFGSYGISHITLEVDTSWYVYFQDGKSAAIEPVNARVFLDAIGLTEDLEPRIGNQAMWDSVLGGDE